MRSEMNNKLALLLSLMAVLLAISACAKLPQSLEAEFGTNFLNPSRSSLPSGILC